LEFSVLYATSRFPEYGSGDESWHIHWETN
jgi:hypothetical protein